MHRLLRYSSKSTKFFFLLAGASFNLRSITSLLITNIGIFFPLFLFLRLLLLSATPTERTESLLLFQRTLQHPKHYFNRSLSGKFLPLLPYLHLSNSFFFLAALYCAHLGLASLFIVQPRYLHRTIPRPPRATPHIPKTEHGSPLEWQGLEEHWPRISPEGMEEVGYLDKKDISKRVSRLTFDLTA